MPHLVKPFSFVIPILLLILGGAHAFAQTPASFPIIDPNTIASDDTCKLANSDPVYTGAQFSLDGKMKEFINSGEIESVSREVIYGFWIRPEDCTIPAIGVSEIKFCFDYVPLTPDAVNSKDLRGKPRTDCNMQTLSANAQVQLGAFLFRARTIDNAFICAEYFSNSTWITMGCRALKEVDFDVDATLKKLAGSCYVGEGCYSTASRHTKNILPFSSVLVQCFQETLYKVFVVDTAVTGECNGRTNLFYELKNGVKKTITALLTLYVIFFGIKIVLGHEPPEDEEVFVFIVKFILVAYFTLGDGVRDDLYPAFINAATSLSQMMFDAGGAPGLCKFTDYKPGYENIALWDAFDCRVLFYLGVYNSATVDALVLGGGAAVLAAFTPPVFALLLPLLLGFQILPLAFLIIFCVFLVSVGFFVIHTYIMALFGITLLMFVSPLFIPLVLFKVTKSYYDAWLKLAISFTLQPMVLFAFLAMMMSVVDTIYYADCQFTDKPLTIAGKDFHFFMINLDNASAACKDSFGFRMNSIARDIFNGEGVQTFDAFLFKFRILQPVGTGGDMLGGLFKLCIFLFFFYHIAQMVIKLCQELTGSITLRNDGEKAVKLIDDAARAVKNYASSKAGNLGGAGKSGGDGGTTKRKL